MNKAKTDKKVWSTPAIQVIPINVAEGSHSGPLCDKHGALSQGTGC